MADSEPVTMAMRWWAATLQAACAPDRKSMGRVWREWTAEAGALGAPNVKKPGQRKWRRWPDGSKIRWDRRMQEFCVHTDAKGRYSYLQVAPATP